MKKKVVVIGGGTGTHTVLSGLKKHVDELDLTAIVSIADNGGSTGRLVDHFGYLPVGDVRMALSALAGGISEPNMVRELLLYRFEKGEEGLQGHNLGNLFLVALTDMLGSEAAAIEKASEILNVCGKVLPASEKKTTLVATYNDGSVIRGESAIDCPSEDAVCQRIVNLSLDPVVPAYTHALSALKEADLIVLGPGDLYTSIVPNLLVEGMQQALAESPGKMVYVANLMTKYGQTDGMSVSDHVAELARYAGRAPDVVMINGEECDVEFLEQYKAKREYPVQDDYQGECVRLAMLAPAPVQSPSDAVIRSLVRHNPSVLGDTLRSLALS